MQFDVCYDKDYRQYLTLISIWKYDLAIPVTFFLSFNLRNIALIIFPDKDTPRL